MPDEPQTPISVTKSFARLKMSVFAVMLVRIFSTFSRLWTEYGEIRSIQSECGMREKCGPE